MNAIPPKNAALAVQYPPPGPRRPAMFKGFVENFNEGNINHHPGREPQCHREKPHVGAFGKIGYRTADAGRKAGEHCQREGKYNRLYRISIYHRQLSYR